VAIEKDTKGTETIVGAVQWIRVGPTGKSIELFALDRRKKQPRIRPFMLSQLTWAQGNLLKPLSAFAMRVCRRLWPNRACDHAMEDILARAHGFCREMWTGERAEAY
jgi:hypothetical protein